MNKHLNNLIKQATFETDPSLANFEELKSINSNLEEIKEELTKPKEEAKKYPTELVDFASKIFNQVRGEKGEKGDRGEKGEKGDRGESIKGEPGRDADEEVIVEKVLKRIPKPKDADENKIINKVLSKIPKPKDGKNGVNGKDAVLNIEELVTKVIDALKNLKGNDRLDISSLRNSEQLIVLLGEMNAKRNTHPDKQESSVGATGKLDMSDLRWHGGGLTQAAFAGAPENLSAQATGANQVFNTTNKIQSIIWLSINGQNVIEGFDFNITGANQITLTNYTPQAGEQVFIKYL